MIKKVIVGFLLLLLFACGGYFLLKKNGGSTKFSLTSNVKKPVIKLAANPWMASELNAEIAKIILEEKMGYPVEIIKVGENEQWPLLAKGDLHANLEVWPSGHIDDAKKYIQEDKTVEDGGKLGAVGKMGWYAPDYVIRKYPELATWEGYKNPELTKIFATAETGSKGRFIAGDPTWIQYDEDIIRNLKLNLKVSRLDSEEKVLSALDSAYKKQEPILLYLWTPHWAHAVYDLVPVALPKYSDDCYAKAKVGGINCDYPADILYKAFWSDLKNYAPDAYQFLKNFHYTTKDQIALMAMVQIDKKTTEEAAREWINQHVSTWKLWIP
jgi:glycine betaine/proline transport system substrate-binding protein